MSIRSLVKQILIQKENRKYANLLASRRMTYDAWVRQREAQNAALEKLTIGSKLVLQNYFMEDAPDGSFKAPRFRCFITSQGTLAENALLFIAQYFAEHPQTQIIYGDEDVLENGVRKSPWFKPDWAPDLLESCFYFGSVVAVRENLIQRAEAICEVNHGDGSEKRFSVHGESLVAITDYNAFEKWIHICVGLSGAYVKDENSRGENHINNHSIGHLSEILFHCKNEEQQKRFLKTSEFLCAVQIGQLRDFEDGWMKTANPDPIVSVVIPSKDHPDILEQCIRGCLNACKAPILYDEKHSGEIFPIEIIVVDNGSSEENRKQIESLIENLLREQEKKDVPEGTVTIKYLYELMDFHFSKMCNLGAKQASGWYLLFLNDDVELTEEDSIARMGALADREWTGAVGMKLLYPDSDKIQHAGITNLPMGPVHKLQFLSDTETYYFNRNRGFQNVLAVTAACLMVEKEKFEEVGGFSEELPVAFNDVDLCFSLYEKGYYNVCMNDMYAYHHESFSRGDDESVEKRERLLSELAKLYARHPKLESVDPYYSKHLNREGLDTRIRPACETAGNRVQQVKGDLQTKNMQAVRKDACVLLRVESVRGSILQGYSVVLGDNNACYDMELLLIRERNDSKTPEEEMKQDASEERLVYSIPVQRQYRPDLTENMQDQKNVGLCGFQIELSEETLRALPKSRYHVGMAVRNRVTGLRLWNNSNCYFYKK